MKKLLISTLALGLVLGTSLAQDAGRLNLTPQDQNPSAPAASTKTFSSFEMGLSFDYPSSWKLIEGPKPAKKGGINLDIFKKRRKSAPTGPKQTAQETLFYIPVGDHTAKLEIFTALYDDTPDLWETIQVDANKQLKREVQKQWREEILGVPLLLTKIGYDDVGQPTNVLIGLVYSRTPRKMQFRLTAPADQYADAEYALRQALQSLHTIAGDMPQPEDPNNPLDPSVYAAKAQVKPIKIISLNTPPANGGKIAKGTVTIQVAMGDKKAVLSMPVGWTATPAPDGSVTLTNPGVPGNLTVSPFSTLDSDAPQSMILKASASSLDEFTTVLDRKETATQTTLAGASVNVIWRVGTAGAGPLTSCEAVGVTGDLFWLAKFKLQGTATSEQRKLVDTLFEGMSLDPTP